jgi:hypothetical protein
VTRRARDDRALAVIILAIASRSGMGRLAFARYLRRCAVSNVHMEDAQSMSCPMRLSSSFHDD